MHGKRAKQMLDGMRVNTWIHYGVRHPCGVLNANTRPPPEGPGSPYVVASRQHSCDGQDDGDAYLQTRLGSDISGRRKRSGQRAGDSAGTCTASSGASTTKSAISPGQMEGRRREDVDPPCGGHMVDPTRNWQAHSAKQDFMGVAARGQARLEKGMGAFREGWPEDAVANGQPELRGCRTCGRRFNERALQRHARACQSVFKAKRKVRMC